VEIAGDHQALLRDPAVATVAREIGARLARTTVPRAQAVAASGAVSPLVRIQPEGSKAPLFLAHPGTGKVHYYLDLAQDLGRDQPVYGLQSPALVAGEPPSRLDEIAAAYVLAVRGLQPHGPYRLGGWSLGGILAYEMAQRLRAQGEETELLVLLDSHAPVVETMDEMDEAELIAALAQDFGLALTGEAGPLLHELRRHPPNEQVDRLLDLARGRGLLPPGLDPEQIRRHWRVVRANVESVSTYAPRPYPGRAVLFRADDQPEMVESLPALGWDQLITGALKVVAVAGNHGALLREPEALKVATEIKHLLAAPIAR
jgi:thioesterase domain-containing protein